MPESYAADLLANWDGTLPIDPAAIAGNCGLEVRAEPELKELQLSGFLDYPNHAILYNPYEPSCRIRFTIAHELGHFLLGHGSANRGSARSNMAMNEVLANRFAAELLMPETQVRSHLELSSAELCKLFGVSALALEYRLKNLGVI